jgi:Chloramphenicol O-acetyltransferase
MVFRWQTGDILVYDRLNATHYVFDEKTETCTPVYTEFTDNYFDFYTRCTADIADAKQKGGYNLDIANHPNYYDASYISWVNYEALNVELPDGHLWFQPITNWGRYNEENGRLMLPLTVRLNHAIADGYLVSKVFLTLKEIIADFCEK